MFAQSDVILYVNRLNTEESVIPFEYHHFDFCPIDESNSPVENLGQVVFGERIRPGPYKIEFMKDVKCAKVSFIANAHLLNWCVIRLYSLRQACTRTYTGGDSESERRLIILKKGMSLNYQHHWIVDNMPVTYCYPSGDDRQFCSTGFPMGCLARSDGVS